VHNCILGRPWRSLVKDILHLAPETAVVGSKVAFLQFLEDMGASAIQAADWQKMAIAWIWATDTNWNLSALLIRTGYLHILTKTPSYLLPADAFSLHYCDRHTTGEDLGNNWKPISAITTA